MRGAAASAHLHVRHDGAWCQPVRCDDRGWHAWVSHCRGRDNCNGDPKGVRFKGLEGAQFGHGQYETAAAWCAAIARQCPTARATGDQHAARGSNSDPGDGFDRARNRHAHAWPSRCFPDVCVKKVPGPSNARPRRAHARYHAASRSRRCGCQAACGRAGQNTRQASRLLVSDRRFAARRGLAGHHGVACVAVRRRCRRRSESTCCAIAAFVGKNTTCSGLCSPQTPYIVCAGWTARAAGMQ